jgi:hypothetical protein
MYYNKHREASESPMSLIETSNLKDLPAAHVTNALSFDTTFFFLTS